MFLVPILIIIAILGISYSGPLLKDLQLSLPSLHLGTSSQTVTPQEKKPTPAKPAQSQAQPTAPRAPPASQTQTPQPTTSNFQKIRITGFQATANSRQASITLQPNFTTESQINISGWKLQSKWSGGFTISLGVTVVHPNFIAKAAEPIVMKKNDVVYIKGEASPFGQGINFRPNECFGYLNQYYQNLPESFSCPSNPKPSLNDVKNLMPACQDYILNGINYGACSAPNYSNQTAVTTNFECTTYLNTITQGFNYEGCLSKHSADANFLSSKWYIYINEAFGNPLHDSITLLDQNGLVVDTYTY